MQQECQVAFLCVKVIVKPILVQEKSQPSQADFNPSPHPNQGRLDLLPVPQTNREKIAPGAVLAGPFVEPSVGNLLR
jgi:hypothetical protein